MNWDAISGHFGHNFHANTGIKHDEEEAAESHICDGQWRYWCEACSGLPDDQGIHGFNEGGKA